MKTLWLLRHAKSSWSDPGLDDFDRPLNKRGRGACAIMGRLIAERGVDPACLVCSPSARTRETLTRVAAFAAFSAAPRFEPMLYEADVSDLMQVIRGLPADAADALIIGHNPGLQDLALALAHDQHGAAGDTPLNRLEDKFPTAALARLSLDIDAWVDLVPGRGQLISFDVPKDHASVV
ncbi:phosphohistidine phosphatase [Rhodothalassium salexigens DSM 2132]|uniref:Phosphohistidine phosphatase n=1 Tax=Rhodothalassium salexigens DSM 2132 TaxID=1188247 RepID=A0A4R2PE53_RHOSA|nr:histidine phosphatase family protein [Rhodothalassium salexigens]MBB4211886.1 phosphohistidine phosphatase [Rhodothalassium salexigens DSM 2132]TCP33530.1 phosphohistidine phosphatase [Rhodothalassium salexigens DSM 2132]